MIATQYIKLNMVPSGYPPVVYMSQYDVGRPIGFIVSASGSTPDFDNYTVTLEGTRSDGVPVTAPVTTDGNICALETTATMTKKADRYPAQIVVTDGSGNRIASIPVTMMVVKAAMDEDAEGVEEDRSLYQQYTGTVQSLIADIRTQLNAEVAARQAAVSAEASARQAADNTLQSNINSEAATRATQDASLQSQINQLVAPEGAAPSAAEVENARVGADGTVYQTLGDAIRGQVTDVKNAIDGNYAKFNAGGFELGQWSSYTTKLSRTYQVRSDDKITFTRATRITSASGFVFYVRYESTTSNGWVNLLDIPAGAPFVITIQRSTVDESETADVTTFVNALSLSTNITEIESEIADLNATVNLDYVHMDVGQFTLGTWSSWTNTLQRNYRVRTIESVQFARDTTLVAASGFRFYIYYAASTPGQWLTEYTVPANTLFKMTIARSTDDTSETASVATFVNAIGVQTLLQDIAIQCGFLNDDTFLLNASLKKEPVIVTYVGTLKYLQSFCIYDGKYYSTNGTHIAEQDSEFNTLRDVSISVGHGSAMQLGSNGVAYVNGWNDRTVYVVDLSTLTVTDTISLPFSSGYTSCVIDDVMGLAYIFHSAQSYESDSHEFVVWDYVNDNVIATYHTQPIATMQGTDMYNDTILMATGLGSVTRPTRVLAFDTTGRIVGEYFLPIFASTELEGVCIDRVTKNMYISTSQSKLYKIA